MTAKHCDRLGLSAQSLIDKLPAIKDDDLTNGVILEILTHFNNGAVDWCALKDSVYSIFGDFNIQCELKSARGMERMQQILDENGRQQHTTCSTHTKGHILCWI